MGVAFRSASRWSSEMKSNPRYPAWKSVTTLYQHLAVSAALSRLCQVSPNQLFPRLTLETDVRSRYTSPSFPTLFCAAPHGHKQQRLALPREPSTHRGQT